LRVTGCAPAADAAPISRGGIRRGRVRHDQEGRHDDDRIGDCGRTCRRDDHPQGRAVAVATRECTVFAFGEAGVCYEAYRIGGKPSWSFIFERSGFDGFSAEDVALCLHFAGEVVLELEGYVFANIGRLREDWRQGRFAAAFARTGQGGRG
jgi:hypothetical protein